ncbi:MAG: DUF885 family protein [Candidatus Bipolaricaulota bacterium]
MRVARKRTILGTLGAGLVLVGVLSGCSPREAASWSPPTQREVAAALEGLTFRDFADTSYRQFLLRTPQTVTEWGLAEALGVRDDRLDDLSDAAVRETWRIAQAILTSLREFRSENLSAEDQILYATCDSYWTAAVERFDPTFPDYAADGAPDGALERLARRFLDVQQLATDDDVRDYLACLRQAGRQIDQITARLRRDAARGVVPPVEVLGQVLAHLAPLRITETFSPSPYLPERIVAGHHPFQTAFRNRLIEITDRVDRVARVAYLAESFDLLVEDVIPAYERLAKRVSEVAGRAVLAAGSLRHTPGGDRAYARRLHDASGVDVDPLEAHRLGREAVAELRAALAEAERVASLEGSMRDAVSDAAAMQSPAIDRWLSGAENATNRVVGQLPQSQLRIVTAEGTVRYIPPTPETAEGATLVVPALEGEVPVEVGDALLREAFPGLHVLLSTWRESRQPSVLAWPVPIGWTEGWRLYALRLADEVGLADGDPAFAVRRLSGELRQALALVVDTGIHALDWSLDDVTMYCTPEMSPEEAAALASEVINGPGRAAAASLALAEILALREAVQQAQGSVFDEGAFHDWLLALGAVSFSVARQALQTGP